MIVIEKMISHLLDPSSNVIVCSDTCMDLQEHSMEMLENKLNKVFTSSQRKIGIFKEGSVMKHQLEAYRSSLDSFEAMSVKMAKYIFETKCKYGVFTPTDLILAEVVYEERRYLVGLDNAYLEGYGHETKQMGEAVENEVIVCSNLLSASLLKKDSAFAIEFGDYSVSSVEAKIEIEGEKHYFYNDIALACDSAPSYQDAMKTMKKACQDVVKQYDLEPVEVMPKMKQIIKENVEAQEEIKVEDIAQVLFSNQPVAKAQFETQVREQGIVKPVPVENIKSSKAEKVQKIRTDKGIELIIPVDYMNSTDYVIFHTGEDGTISIELRNINRIISK